MSIVCKQESCKYLGWSGCQCAGQGLKLIIGENGRCETYREKFSETDRKRMREKVCKIMRLALLLNPDNTDCDKTGDKPTVFISFSGHVSQLNMRVYQSGYDGERNGIIKEMNLYTNEDYDDADADKMIAYLESLCGMWDVKTNG